MIFHSVVEQSSPVAPALLILIMLSKLLIATIYVDKHGHGTIFALEVDIEHKIWGCMELLLSSQLEYSVEFLNTPGQSVARQR